MARYGLTGLAALLGVAGCYGPSARLNSPPQGHTDRESTLNAHFIPMVDSAMLSDRSIADIHFVPHRAELNTLGMRRLSRMAQLVEVYGGEVRYATSLTDENLVRQRMESVRHYLHDVGLPDEQIVVVQALPGGRGLTGDEVVRIKQASEFTPKKEGGGGLAGLLGLGGGN